MIYLVLGMHKSGTTLTAQLLSHAGINMGFDLDASEEEYGYEKCEGRLLRHINKTLLNCGDTHSLDIQLPATLNHTFQTNADAHELIKQQSVYPHWGLKDPRLVHTYPYWKKKLPDHKIVFVYRDPIEVAGHYTRENVSQGTFKKALRTWKEYNLAILNIMKETSRENYICVQYEALMKGDSELECLSEFIQLPITDKRTYPGSRKSETNLAKKRIACLLNGCYWLKFKLHASRFYL